MRRIYLLFIIACAALVSCAQKEPKAEEVFDNVDSKTGICINLDILLYNEQVCGKINVYLKYNSNNKKMYINNIKFQKT